MRIHNPLPPLWWFAVALAIVVAFIGIILYALFRLGGWLLAAVVVLVVLGAIGAGAVFAQDNCELGTFGCGHQEQHHQYQQWKQKDGKGSCCNGDDCRPVRARLEDDGTWSVWIPEFRRWLPVPAYAVGDPDRFGDGRNHVCSSKPNASMTFHIFCFSPTGSKS